ncbi:MAG: carbohydrate ABC transporter permease [Solirubrobacteraceae bacterium]|jgi:multiple sugar transport system permease protein
MSRHHRKTAVRWLSTLVAFVAVALMLFPIYAIVVASFESTVTIFSTHFHFFPYHPTLANYKTVVLGTQSGPAASVTTNGNQLGHVLTSLEIALATALLTLVISVPAAYALAKYRMRVTVVFIGALLLAQIVPSIVLATSLFAVLLKVGMVNTLPGVILADCTYAVPFGILVLRAFLFALPNEVMHSARVDGASEWQTFRMIVLPLARSAIVTVAVFAFLAGWGDFIFALTTLNGASFEPITLGIYSFLGNYQANWGAVMAAGVVALVPAAVLLVIAQRYIATGLTAGAVKG